MRIVKGIFAVAALALGNAAVAVPITFIHEGEGAGSIDGTSFASTGFEITATGDTDDIQNQGPSVLFIDHLSASIDIDGVGTFDFVTATRTFVNHVGELVGFSRAGSGGADLFNGPSNPAFGAWDMTTSIGPHTGGGNTLQWTSGDVLTSGGVLNFESRSTTATFEAIVDVPEPGALTLLGIGLVGFGFVRLRRAT